MNRLLKSFVAVTATAVTLGTGALFAQDLSTSNTLAFNNISFQFDANLAENVSVVQVAGEDPSLEQPGGPEVPHTQFVFYDGLTPPPNTFESIGVLRVYETANLADYEFAQNQLTLLTTLLADNPDLATYETTNAVEDAGSVFLPFLPIVPAGQIIRAQTNYVTTASWSGISYITVFRQDVSPFTSNEFIYTLQALSNDGQYYVAAQFRSAAPTDLFPEEIPSDFDYDDFDANFEAYLEESIASLDTADLDSFTPSLALLNTFFNTISLGGVEPIGSASSTQVVPTTAPDAEATPSDDTGALLGSGLTGVTWTLVSYGPTGIETLPVNLTPLTLAFSESGVSGNGGCNQFNGDFTFDNNTLTIGPLVSTLRACLDDAATAQETQFLTALQTATTFDVDEATGQLLITYAGDGTVPAGTLVFTSNPVAEATPEVTETAVQA